MVDSDIAANETIPSSSAPHSTHCFTYSDECYDTAWLERPRPMDKRVEELRGIKYQQLKSKALQVPIDYNNDKTGDKNDTPRKSILNPRNGYRPRRKVSFSMEPPVIESDYEQQHSDYFLPSNVPEKNGSSWEQSFKNPQTETTTTFQHEREELPVQCTNMYSRRLSIDSLLDQCHLGTSQQVATYMSDRSNYRRHVGGAIARKPLKQNLIHIQPPLPPPPPPSLRPTELPLHSSNYQRSKTDARTLDINLTGAGPSCLLHRHDFPLNPHLRSEFPSSLPLLSDKEVGGSDLSTLSPLTEEAILHNLSARHKRDQIYTYIGTSLVSVNPYRRLALYTPQIIDAYNSNYDVHSCPHIYGIADASHRGVWERHENQLILAIGESGGGKTESLKLILQYIAAVTPNSSYAIRQRLLQSNPILEAFGNARTKKNENSSRFGKYMDIEFDFKGDPVGGSVSCYLLEKSRVTSFSSGERNFHIFYQILSGADIHTLKNLKLLRNLDNYKLLKASRSGTTSEAMDDKTEFSITKKAFDALGLTTEEQLDLLKVVAVVLKLANIVFIPTHNIDDTEGCSVENEYELHEVSDLLQIDAKELLVALKSRSIDTRDDEVVFELPAIEAARERDILCRALYNRLFSWLVTRINEAIKVKFMGKKRIFGLLDVFGFENLENNTFEQLIINYCNEKLYIVLNKMTMKDNQDLYLRECLDYEFIDFPSNNATIELLEMGRASILNVIENASVQQCLDETSIRVDVLQQLVGAHKSHPSFEAKGARYHHCDNNFPQDAFRIRHFAGLVTYTIQDFREKNVDNLSKNLAQAMYNCCHPIVKTIFPEGNPRRATIKRSSSIVSQAQVSIDALVRTLQGKQLNLIYCLKPNELSQPRLVEQDLLAHQIKYLNLVQQSKIRHEGWAYHETHENFLKRYRMVSLHTWPRWNRIALEGCAVLLADLPISPTQYAFGRTRVFVKTMKIVNDLEQFRYDRLNELALLIQKTWKGWHQKRTFRRFKVAQKTIVTAWRMWKIKQRAPRNTKTVLTGNQSWRLFFLAREEVRDMKQKKKEEWACRIIQIAYTNHKRRNLITQLITEPPSESPIGMDWPPRYKAIEDLSDNLRRLHHVWRCYRYRIKFDQTSRNRMREKVTASLIFKDRKASYPRSISHPFIGDYVRLRQNGQWKRLSSESDDQYLVFADMVNKIARSSGKFVPILLAVSTNALLILDQRTLQIKYRIPAGDILRISLSPFLDDIAVLHIRPTSPILEMSGSQNLNPGCLFGSDEVKRKGDLILQTCHIIEVVTKLFLVVQNAIGKPPEISICTEFEANFGQNIVLVTFKTAGIAEMVPSQIRIQRRHNRMEVVL